jgi:hypothetical protein
MLSFEMPPYDWRRNQDLKVDTDLVSSLALPLPAYEARGYGNSQYWYLQMSVVVWYIPSLMCPVTR